MIALRNLLTITAMLCATAAFAQDIDPDLLAKAQTYDDEIQARHVPAYGGIVDVIYNETTWDTVAFYQGQGDSTMWTSTYAVTQAFRYAVTGEDEALQNVAKAIETLQNHLLVTGRPGYVGRYVGPLADAAFWIDVYGLDWFRVGEGEWLGTFWLSNSSSDQHVGFFFAMGMVHELVDDPDVRAMIEAMVREVIDALIDQNWWIITEEGVPSTAAPNLDGAERLAFALVAARILGDQKYWDEYDRVFALDEPLLAISSWALYNRYNEYFAMNLRHDNYMTLFMFEEDPDRLALYFDTFDRMTRPYVDDGHQTFFDYVYLLGCERAGRCEHSEAIMQDGVTQLSAFTSWPNNDIHVDPGPPPGGIDPLSQTLVDILADLPDWLVDLIGLDFALQAADGYDIAHRCRRDYTWQRSPYLMTCAGYLPQKLYTGSDYLMAYWLGRYTDYLNPKDIDAPPADDDADDDDADDDMSDDDTSDDDAMGDDDAMDDDAADDDVSDDDAADGGDSGSGCGC